jgi:DNA recombination protein RmuC
MDIIFLIVGIFAGAIIGFLISRSKSQSSAAKLEEINKSFEESKNDLQTERSKVLGLTADLSKSNADLENLNKKLQEQKSDIAELQQKFISEFENLAAKILEDKSKRFTEQNKENIDTILTPLKEKITDFEKRVNEVYISETRERASLAEQIKNLTDLNKQMTEDANNLTRALKGDSKTQGDWGEFILESMLEKAGLVKGREFFIQESVKTEDGSLLRPDVIINLPDNKSVIIDSKVSLTAYEAFTSGDGDEIKKRALNEHINSIRKHIKNLSPKEYQNLYGLQSLDFVLMFIPIEPAFYLALQNDNGLYTEALEKNILLISPSSLFPALKTVASMWRQERQNKNAMEIAKQSGALYDKFVGFVEDLVVIGRKIDGTKESYTEAMKKLHEGSGNLIRRVENIKQLGAKTSKSLPNNLLERADENENLKLIDPEENTGR